MNISLNIITKSGYHILSQILYSGRSFLLGVLMARILSKEDFGIYAMIAIGLLNLILVLNTIVYEPYAYIQNTSDNNNKFIFTYFCIKQAVINLAVIILLIIFSFFKAAGKQSSLIYIIVIYYTIVQIFMLIRNRELVALRPGRVLKFELIVSAALAGLLFILVFLYKADIELKNILVIISLSFLPVIIYSGFWKNIFLYKISDININIKKRKTPSEHFRKPADYIK